MDVDRVGRHERLYELVAFGRGPRQGRCGAAACRPACAIAREVDRGGRAGYRPAVAHDRAALARLRPRDAVLAIPGLLRDRINAELRPGRSPSAIRADHVAEGHVGIVCVETIYTAVYNGVLDVKPSACLRSPRPRRRHRQARHPDARAGLPNIASRPANVNDRSEPGHWKGDHILGKHNSSGLMSLTERETRFTILITMPDGYDANAALAGLVVGLEQIPPHLRGSLTFDQGSEWASSSVSAEGRQFSVVIPQASRRAEDRHHERSSGSLAATSSIAARSSPERTSSIAHARMSASTSIGWNGRTVPAGKRRQARRTASARSAGNWSRSTDTLPL